MHLLCVCVLKPMKQFISGQPDFGHNCFGGAGVTVRGYFSFDCKLDLYVLDDNLTGQKYRDNVLAPRVVPHFDNSDKIWKVWKKNKLNSEKIWKICKKSQLNNKTSTVDITSSPCSIWLVTWSFGVDFSHMETGPLVWWKSFFVTPYRRSCKDLTPMKQFISGQPHFGHNCFGGAGVTVRGYFSFDCKLDLYVLDDNLTGQKYRDNVLAPRVVPHFDNHALADRPMFMDDNARPHRARIVQHCLQQEAVQTIPWPAMSPDMNPIELVWDFVSNIPRLTKTLHQSYNDGMVNPEVVCHPSMAKTTVVHANSLVNFRRTIPNQ
jgi:transposase